MVDLNTRFSKAIESSEFSPKPMRTLQDWFLVIGHRGMGAESASNRKTINHFPENRIGTFNQAFSKGLKVIELDVVATKECNSLVVNHNMSINLNEHQHLNVLLAESIHTKNSKNLISQLTRDQIDEMLKDDPWLKENIRTDIVKDDNWIPEQWKPLPEFTDVLGKVNEQLAIDVEIKYPTDTPISVMERASRDGTTFDKLNLPHSYYTSINKITLKALSCLWDFGGTREFLFSSFNTEVVYALKQMQSTIPVLFISDGGCPALPRSSPQVFISQLDPRHAHVIAAANWAAFCQLDGMVIPFRTIEQSLDQDITAAVSILRSSNMSFYVYGPQCSDPEAMKRIRSYGADGIFLDDIEAYYDNFDSNNIE